MRINLLNQDFRRSTERAQHCASHEVVRILPMPLEGGGREISANLTECPGGRRAYYGMFAASVQQRRQG